MKCVLVADTHLGIYQSSDLWHGIVLNLFKEIREYCDENKIHTIIHLGDFFHDRKVLNTKSQFVAHQIAENLEGIDTFLIIGNHDLYYKDNLVPTSLDVFKNYPDIHIIREVFEMQSDRMILCPWGTIPEGFRSGYVFGHFEFSGFKMNSNYLCQTGENPDSQFWRKFKVFSGHFHWPSINDHITYLGSAYPQTFHDVDSPRGYYLFDSGELTFIEYKSAPKFVKIQTNNINNEIIRNNIVKLIFTEDYGSVKNQQIIDEVLSFGPTRLQPDFSQAKLEGTEEKIEISDVSLLDHDEIIDSYVGKIEIPPHMNKKTVITMMKKLKEGEE